MELSSGGMIVRSTGVTWTRGVVILILALTAPSQSEGAQDPAQKGEAVAREADRRDRGYGDSTASVTMVLKDRRGRTRERRLRISTLETPDDGDKLLVIFDEPRDVAGTAFLTWTHKSAADDQWLYLPALKRIKRISSNNKSSPFMGSEFAYEDLASQEVEKFTYRFIREEPLNERSTLVVERSSVDPQSGYARSVVWFDKTTHRLEKIEFYDRKDDLLKTLTYSKYQQYLGKHWRADELFMDNHQTDKSTLLRWKDYQFGTGLADRDFSQNILRRVR